MGFVKRWGGRFMLSDWRGPKLLPKAATAPFLPTVYRIWPVGTWYQPCQWWDVDCRKRIFRERAEGRYNMQ